MDASKLTEEYIIARLSAAEHLFQPASIYSDVGHLLELIPGESKSAAVLVPLLIDGSEWKILYTRRNDQLPEHSGQVAFPGGSADPGDESMEFTALRESWEEIGLKPADVRVLGRLGNYRTITNYDVTPIIGIIPWPYSFNLAHHEVSRAFTIPISWLVQPFNYDIVLRDLPQRYPPTQVIYYHPFDGEILWGATARMTQALLSILGLLTEKPA